MKKQTSRSKPREKLSNLGPPDLQGCARRIARVKGAGALFSGAHERLKGVGAIGLESAIRTAALNATKPLSLTAQRFFAAEKIPVQKADPNVGQTFPTNGKPYLVRYNRCHKCGAARESFEFELSTDQGPRTATPTELMEHGFHVAGGHVDMVASLIGQQINVWNGVEKFIHGTEQHSKS